MKNCQSFDSTFFEFFLKYFQKVLDDIDLILYTMSYQQKKRNLNRLRLIACMAKQPLFFKRLIFIECAISIIPQYRNQLKVIPRAFLSGLTNGVCRLYF